MIFSPYKKYSIEKYDDQFILDHTEYTSFNKDQMKKIYDYIKKHTKELNEYYAHIKFEFDKNFPKVNYIEFMSTSYNFKD